MNPGLAEETGKTARSVIEGLTSTPLVLALIVLNLIFLGFLVWVLNEVSSINQNQISQNTKMIAELQESLRICRQLIPK